MEISMHPNPMLVMLGLAIIAYVHAQRAFQFTVEAVTGERVLVPPLLHPSKVPKTFGE